MSLPTYNVNRTNDSSITTNSTKTIANNRNNANNNSTTATATITTTTSVASSHINLMNNSSVGGGGKINARTIGRDSITNTTTAIGGGGIIIDNNTMSVIKLSETNSIISSSNSNKSVTTSTENCSDSEEDFDRTTRKLGAPHKWIFNYEDDTRTHVVVELFNTEKSYVESLETVVKKYLTPLKTPEYASLIDGQTVDDIFLMVPSILNVHEKFLGELRKRLDAWEPLQRVGDAFVEVFSTATVLETYTLFVNNVNRAKAVIRATCSQRPAFARFLEAMAREHKGKLTLDNLLIKPVQKFPNYELMFSRLIKHTELDHPDQKPLQEALKLVHDILLHLNCKEREALENDQREGVLRELEGVIEGISDLVTHDRQFLLFDLVSMPHGQGGRKERGFFLFNDILIITSIKRRSGTIKKPTSTTCPGSVASTLDSNKYKLLMKVAIEDLDIVKAKDDNLRKIMKEIDRLTEDCSKLQQILEIVITLRSPHQALEENARELQKDLQRQLNDRQTNDSQLSVLELSINSSGSHHQQQHMTVVFPKSEKRAQWEKSFYESKQKIMAILDRHPIPEFITSIPIRKTRAGLQFTCAAATLGLQKDVWVCNSDGYVGQVCVLSLVPEPTVTSCNGVCNARILCVASVPAYNPEEEKRAELAKAAARLSRAAITQLANSSQQSVNTLEKKNSNVSVKSVASVESVGGGNGNERSQRDIQLDSSSSSDDSEELEQNQPLSRTHSQKASSTPQLSTSAPQPSTQTPSETGDESEPQQPTMWLGTEDGCIHVYNCTDNIRIKKNKIKIQQVSAVYSILYLDNKVFVSLANGELVIYVRERNGWNTTSPTSILLGSATNPVSKLLNVHGKLWCSVQGSIKIINTSTLQVENQIQISSDIKPITNMAVYNNLVWISVQNSAQIKCFHSNSLTLLFEVNLAPSVNKMLSNCDDIIRQHKAACLRVTSLLACKDLIWIGTSAGVILTISVSSQNRSGNSSYGSSIDQPIVTGIPYGHTGHVRFLTCVDYVCSAKLAAKQAAITGNDAAESTPTKRKSSSNTTTTTAAAAAAKLQSNAQAKGDWTPSLLIISGGDGFEDFRNSGLNPTSEIAGREDSTNHLLLWQV